MHNVKRSFKKKTREEQALALVKIGKFRGLAQLLLKQQQRKVYTPEALAMTEQMLTRNCDFHVIWNYRREILLHLIAQAEAAAGGDAEAAATAVQELEARELSLTKRCVAQENPKSYCTWHHRRWVVSRGNCDLAAEVALCTEFLKLDERNFHCWNYRRFVVAMAGVPVEDEFAYTTDKIAENFSNYSSLHYRVSLFDRVIAARAAAENNVSDVDDDAAPAAAVAAAGDDDDDDTTALRREIAAELLREEMELVQNAIFTEPDDQSCWMHVRCLIKWAAGGGVSGPDGAGAAAGAGAEAGDAARGVGTGPNTRTPPVDEEVLGDVVDELTEHCRTLLEEEGDCKWALLCLFELLSNSWGGSTQDVADPDNLAERRKCLDKLCAVDATHLRYYSQRKGKLA